MYSETENYEIIMNKATDRKTSKTKRFVMLTVAAVMLVMLGLTFLICCYTLKAESHVRYVLILNVASERIAKTITSSLTSTKARTTGSMWRVRWDQAKRTIRSLNCISKPRN